MAIDATSAKHDLSLVVSRSFPDESWEFRATEDAVLNVSDMAALDEFGSGSPAMARYGGYLPIASQRTQLKHAETWCRDGYRIFY